MSAAASLAAGRLPTLIASLFMAGNGMVLPLLPLIARERGASYGAAGLLLMSYGVTRLGSDLLAARGIERWGVRRIGAAGCAIVASAAVATAAVSDLTATAACWGAVGIGSSLVLVSLYGTVLSTAPPQLVGRAFALFFSGFNVGIVGGAVLGGVLADRFGVEAVLYANAAVALACLPAFRRLARRTGDRGTEAASELGEAPRALSAGGLLRASPLVLTALLVEAAGMWTMVGVLETALPLFARERLLLSPFEISVVFAVVLAAELAFMYPMGRWVDRVGHRIVLVCALAGMLVVVPLLPLADSHAELVLGAALLGVTTGAAAVAPASMLRRGLGEQGLARASGVLLFFGDIGFILGPVGAGLAIGAAGFDWAFAILAAPLVITLAVVLRTPQRRGAR